MGIKNDKNKLFTKLAVYRSFKENLPKGFDINTGTGLNSFRSPDLKSNNIIRFMLDLQKQLTETAEVIILFEKLLDAKLPEIERKVLDIIASQVKQTYSCGHDIGIPQQLKTGVTLEIDKFDFFGLFKMDADSEAGKLIYGSVSEDLNAFIKKQVIPSTTVQTWKNMLDFTFVGPKSIKVQLNPSYTNTNFDQFIKDYLSTMSFFSVSHFMSLICEYLSGTLSSAMHRTPQQIAEEEMMSQMIDAILDSGDDDLIDDDYFVFSDDQIEGRAAQRSKGENYSDVGCGVLVNAINLESLSEAISLVEGSKQTASRAFKGIIDQNLAGVNHTDRRTAGMQVYEDILSNLPKIMANAIFSPKIYLMLDFCYMTQGSLPTAKTGVEFIKKNRSLVKKIVKELYGIVVEYIFEYLKKEITALAVGMAAVVAKELYQNYRNTIKGLTGTGSAFGE